MKCIWMIHLLISGILLIKLCHGQGLSVVGPKVLRPSTPYRVVISNFLPTPVSLKIKLSGAEFKQQKTVFVKRDTVKHETFKIGNITEGDYSLQINSTSPNFGFEDDVDLIFNRKTESIFIQLDKPLYKPGDVIKFRIIVIDMKTLPATNIKTVHVSINDGKNNLITQWPFGKLQSGVFESSFQIASSPNLGKWIMKARAGNSETIKHFELRKYVLPQFHVKVYPAEILIASKKQIILIVEASYTSGGPVKGQLSAEIFLDGYRKRPNFSVTKTIEGQTTIEFFLRNEIEVKNNAVRLIQTRVTVNDTLTSRSETVTQDIPIYQNPYRFSISSSNPFFQPGINFTVKLNIRDRNGVPANRNKLATIYFEDDDYNQWSNSKAPNSEGVVEFNFIPKNTSLLRIMKVKYDTLETSNNIIKEIRATNSMSKIYLKVTLDLKVHKVRPGETVTFDIQCSERPQFFTYIFISRGSIVDSGSFRYRNTFDYTFRKGMAPKTKLVVMFMKNYLIYDKLDLIFDKLDNDFNFSLDLSPGVNYKPGQIMYVDFKAVEDSYVAFHAIDQSVLRISQSDHLFTINDLLKDLDLYDGTEENEVDEIHSMGLFLRSNVPVDSSYGLDRLTRFGSFSPRKVEKPISVRTMFPESWLWDNHMMVGNSNGEISAIVPDSLTTWLITGFALSPSHGLGLINQPVNMKVDRNFFIVVNLPYSIKRKEVAVIEAIVFNKLGAGLTVQVKLYRKTDDFEFYEDNPESSNKPKESFRMKSIFIENNNAKSVSFLIEAKKLGEIVMNIEAVADEHSDSVEHLLRVIPESQTERKFESGFLELAHSTYRKNITIDQPRNIDPGSFKLEFLCDPSLLGAAYQNLDHLIDMPTGCCEQSMVKFVPNIVLLDYLKATNNVDEATNNKLKNYLKQGYQNQMKCKKMDGSFSIFSNKGGSVFLTAFISKSTKIAAKHIDVDTALVNNAFIWLSNKQKEDGKFIDEQDVFMRDMQGATRTTSFALTAYVLAAFLETEENGNKYKNITDKCIEYLVSNFNYMDHPYDLAVTSYAMSLAKKQTPDFLGKLTALSHYNETARTRYWNESHLSVEIAGYALLAKINLKHLVDSTSIMRWLNTQRYSLGAFSGTQSTFVGLKAMAKYMEYASPKSNEYTVSIKSDTYRKQFNVKPNSFNVQRLEINSSNKLFEVEVSGNGIGYYQFAWQYNLNILNNTRTSFDLNVTVTNTTSYNNLELNVCFRFSPRENYKTSNMVLVELSMPSGIVATNDAVEDLSPRKEISKVEAKHGGTFLNIYYTNVDQTEKCFKVSAERRFRVAMHRPSYVVVYDYYDNRHFAIKTYDAKIVQPCDICDDEDCSNLSCH